MAENKLSSLGSRQKHERRRTRSRGEQRNQASWPRFQRMRIKIINAAPCMHSQRSNYLLPVSGENYALIDRRGFRFTKFPVTFAPSFINFWLRP